MLAVDYQKLVPVLIEAIKELSAIVDKHESFARSKGYNSEVDYNRFMDMDP